MTGSQALDQVYDLIAQQEAFAANGYNLFAQNAPNTDLDQTSTVIANNNSSLTSTPITDKKSFINPTASNSDASNSSDKSFIMINNSGNLIGNSYNHILASYTSTIDKDASISPTLSISAQVDNLNLLNENADLFACANLANNVANSLNINSSLLPTTSTSYEHSSLSNLIDPGQDLSACRLPESNYRDQYLAKLEEINNKIQLNNLTNQILSNNSLSNSYSSNDELSYLANGINDKSYTRGLSYNLNGGGRGVSPIGNGYGLIGRNNSPRNEFDNVKSQPDWRALSPSKVDYEGFKRTFPDNTKLMNSSYRLNGCNSQSKLFDYLSPTTPAPTTPINSSQHSTPKKNNTSNSSKASSPADSLNNISHSSSTSSTTSMDWGNEPLLEAILELMFTSINPNDPAQQKFLEQRSALLEEINEKFKAKLRSKVVNGKTLEYPVWEGKFLSKIVPNATYSRKVFLGGVPFDVESKIPEIFKEFGKVVVHRPKEGNPMRCGHLYASFESEAAVKKFLSSCEPEIEGGKLKFFTNLSSVAWRFKRVEVKPWILENSVWSKTLENDEFLSPSRTIFVGGLHGTMTAEHLVEVMEKVFGEVLYVSFDTDRAKYPGGSCRMVFKSIKSYILAILAEYVDVVTAEWTKRLQINPYVHNSLCAYCAKSLGSIFCCDLACLRYHCQGCFNKTHNNKLNHRYIVKKNAESK